MRRLSSARLVLDRCPLGRYGHAGAIGTMALLTAAIGNGLIAAKVTAQLPACQPPQANEYLLLAVIPDADAQARVTALLPVSTGANICNYLGENVLRVGGFGTPESANAWTAYIAQQAKVSAFVAKPPLAGTPSILPPLPPAAPAVTLPTTPAPLPTTPAPSTPTVTSYNPQPLGSGYAVLVNYYNNPELAKSVQASSGQAVGLVSYGQKPFLLASFTSDQSAANVLLQALTDKGLWAMVVDGRRVMLLKPNVGQ